MRSILTISEHISFDRDPPTLLTETAHQPTISLFHMTKITKNYPRLKGLPDHTSTVTIEVCAGPALDPRNLVCVKLKNAIPTNDFESPNAFGRRDGNQGHRPSSDPLSGFTLTVITLFSTYTIGTFTKTRIQAGFHPRLALSLPRIIHLPPNPDLALKFCLSFNSRALVSGLHKLTLIRSPSLRLPPTAASLYGNVSPDPLQPFRRCFYFILLSLTNPFDALSDP